MTFKNTKQLGQIEADRKAIYDIYCESENSERFIVELQKAKQNYFIERTIYYSIFPKRALFHFPSPALQEKAPKADEVEQAEKGNWNYSLKVFRDNKATFDYAVETAYSEGHLDAKTKIAKALKE